MNTMTQAFRAIPGECAGQEIELAVCPLCEGREYNEETLAAMQEAEDIRSGKIKAKTYSSMEELYADLDAEEDEC